VTSVAHTIVGSEGIAELTFALSDGIAAKYRPVVSGYTVTFAAPWPSTATSTVILSGAPEAGKTWTLVLDIAGTVKNFSHLVVAGDTLATISQALADAINADPAGNLSARANGVALTVVNVAGNTLSTSFSIGPQATAVTPDPVQSYARSLDLSGTPSVGAVWSVTVSFFDPAVGGLVTSTHSYAVQASASLAEVAAGLAAKINAAGTSFSARVQGNTLVIENAAEAGFSTATRVSAPAGTLSTTGSFTRSVASPTTTRLTLNSTLTGTPIGETWSVTVGGVTYSYTVESLEAIAAKLAARSTPKRMRPSWRRARARPCCWSTARPRSPSMPRAPGWRWVPRRRRASPHCRR
jgi:hypothetical protein